MSNSPASNKESAAFRIVDLVKWHPGKARPTLDGVTLQIERGEVFGILGGNGAGKTTLVQQMLTLGRPTSGHVELFGRNIWNSPCYVQRLIGHQAQKGAPLLSLPISQLLKATTRLRGFSRMEARMEAERLLELWGLGDVSSAPMALLSTGQLRLCHIALAMVGRPPVLVLDEPTAGLDPDYRRRAWQVIAEASTTEAVTVVLVTHDAVEAERIVDRVALMKDGKIAASGHLPDLGNAVDGDLRLEVSCTSAAVDILPSGFQWQEKGAGHFSALIQAAKANEVLAQIDLTKVESVRLRSTTLEDLYFHYAEP
jgi:ABC-2 type transport system ATP-binding protein